MTDDHQTPTEALASIRDSRASVDDRLNRAHWSLDVLYGAACAIIVGGQGLPQPIGILSVAVGLAGLAVMVSLWRKQTGLWVSGLSPRRARWVALGLGAALVGFVVAGMVLNRVTGLWWPSLAVGVVAGVSAVAASRLWTRVYRRELAEEGA